MTLVWVHATGVSNHVSATTRRKNKDGSIVEYYQLAHNERHPDTRKPLARIIHSFGRTDKLDRDQLVRLCNSIARVCGLEIFDPINDSAEQTQPNDAFGFSKDLKLIKTLAFGCVLAIEALWERLGIGKELTLPQISRHSEEQIMILTRQLNKAIMPHKQF